MQSLPTSRPLTHISLGLLVFLLMSLSNLKYACLLCLGVLVSWSNCWSTRLCLIPIAFLSPRTSLLYGDIKKALVALDFLLREAQAPETPLLIQLARLVLENNYLSTEFSSDIFHQKYGIPMGTPFAVTVANAFMYHHEKDMKIVDQYSNYLTLYQRFISLWTGSLFWEGVKKSQEEGRKRVRACRQTFEAAILPHSCLLVADHLSARSLSVTWIHWNVINFACKKGVGRQHTTFTSCQNAAFSNEFFLLWRV